MKNSILLAGALLLVLTSLVSCKKEYTCQCSKTYTSGTGSSTQNHSIYTYKDSRINAEARCDDNASSGSDIYGNYSINCEIK